MSKTNPIHKNSEKRTSELALHKFSIDGKLEGYAAKYGTEYRYDIETEHGPVTIVETILPGAFNEELIKRSDIRATLNHDPNIVLARSKYGAGSLTLTADDIGLHFSFVPPKSRPDLIESVQRGDIDQCSYWYDLDEQGEALVPMPDGTVRREIRSILQMHDICIATYPAYTDTNVSYVEKRTAEKIEAIAKAKESKEENEEEEEEDEEKKTDESSEPSQADMDHKYMDAMIAG